MSEPPLEVRGAGISYETYRHRVPSAMAALNREHLSGGQEQMEDVRLTPPNATTRLQADEYVMLGGLATYRDPAVHVERVHSAFSGTTVDVAECVMR